MSTVVHIVLTPRRRYLCSSILLILALVTPALVSAQPTRQVTITELGALGDDFPDSIANAINNQGEIVGKSLLPSDGPFRDEVARAVLWQTGVVSTLANVPDHYATANEINNRGQIVGMAATPDGPFGPMHAFLWQNGVMTDLGSLGGNHSIPEDINEQGQIVGSSTTASGESHAFLWQNGVMTDLGSLGGEHSSANAINEQGQIVGSSTTASGEGHAFLWQNGVMTDLGSLGGQYVRSTATDINEQGQIVGYSQTASGQDHAVLWQNGGMTDLGTLGDEHSSANAINEQGQIVGSSTTASGESHAFLWQNGVITDLGSLGGQYIDSSASDLNEQGQIVGYSSYTEEILWCSPHAGCFTYTTEYPRATLWTIKAPTPEEQITALKAQLDESLTLGVLNRGQHQALTNKLDGALHDLGQNNKRAATNKLHAFVNQVTAYERARILTGSQAQLLRNTANTIIFQLER